MTSRIPYGKQSVGFSEGIALLQTLYSRNLTQGPRIIEFEECLMEFTGAQHAVAVSSGTAALQLAALASNLKQGKRTAIPSLTFAATASSVLLAGGKLHIADVNRETWNIDLKALKGFDGNLVSVDFAGLPSGVSKREISQSSDTLVIEDCAHSLGAVTPFGNVGNCAGSDMACVSFHPVKTITTGEGGAVLTNSAELAEKVRILRSHGMDKRGFEFEWEYDIKAPGQNFRMTDLQATVGTQQLKKIHKFVENRNEIAERYRHLLQMEEIVLPPSAPPGFTHSYHLFPVLLRSQKVRNQVYVKLKELGIDCQVHYKPLHRLSAFASFAKAKLPVASDIGDRILSLPIFFGLEKKQQVRVVESLKVALKAVEINE